MIHSTVWVTFVGLKGYHTTKAKAAWLATVASSASLPVHFEIQTSQVCEWMCNALQDSWTQNPMARISPYLYLVSYNTSLLLPSHCVRVGSDEYSK